MAKHDDKPAVDAAAAATTTSVLSNDIATVAVEDSLCAVAPVSIVPPVSPHSQEIEIDKLTQPSVSIDQLLLFNLYINPRSIK